MTLRKRMLLTATILPFDAMSQGVEFDGVLEGLSTRSDGSLGIRVSTGEFTAEDKLAMFSLQNIACKVSFVPIESEQAPKEIKSELSRKTDSQRLRAVLFILWKQAGEFGSFESQYSNEMSKIIEAYKKKLKPI